MSSGDLKEQAFWEGDVSGGSSHGRVSEDVGGEWELGSWVVVSHIYDLTEKDSGWAKGQVQDSTKFLQGLVRADDAEKSDGDILEGGAHGRRALGAS